jgi:hypothetical protein
VFVSLAAAKNAAGGTKYCSLLLSENWNAAFTASLYAAPDVSKSDMQTV